MLLNITMDFTRTSRLVTTTFLILLYNQVFILCQTTESSNDTTVGSSPMPNNVSNCAITTMCPPENFDGVQRADSMRWPCRKCSPVDVDCTDAGLTYVCPEMVASTVRYLTLSYNQYGPKIPINMFSNASSLLRLDLSHNYIETVSYEDFANSMQLETLILSNNPIRNFTNSLFAHLPRLRCLEMSNAFLERLNADFFGPNVNEYLEDLEVSSNQLIRIPFEALEKVPQLRQLDLGGNRIRLLRESGERGDLYLKLAHLETLMLDHNEIEFVYENTFAFLPELRRLNLAHNVRLIYIDPNAFGYAAYRLPAEFPEPNFVATTGLELTELYLQGNSLRRLHPALLKWPNLVRLDVRNNPWACDCSMNWTLNLWVRDNVAVYPIEIVCDYPEYLAGRPLPTLMEHDMQCFSTPGGDLRQPGLPTRYLHHIAFGYVILLVFIVTVVGVFLKYGDRMMLRYGNNFNFRNIASGDTSMRRTGPHARRKRCRGTAPYERCRDNMGAAIDTEDITGNFGDAAHAHVLGDAPSENTVKFEKSTCTAHCKAKDTYVRVTAIDENSGNEVNV